MTSPPLVTPTGKSHLGHITRPKKGLTVTVPAEDGVHLGKVQLPFTPVLAHLTPLEQGVAQPLDLPKVPQPGSHTIVEFPLESLPDDSDVDLDTGETRNASISEPTAIKLT